MPTAHRLYIGTISGGRVEEWRGRLGGPCVLAGPFGCRCPSIPPCAVSTPRSSNRTGGFTASGSRTKVACLRPQQASRKLRERDQTQLLVQDPVRVGAVPASRHLVLPTEPPTEPVTHVPIHAVIDATHRTEAEVVGPTA